MNLGDRAKTMGLRPAVSTVTIIDKKEGFLFRLLFSSQERFEFVSYLIWEKMKFSLWIIPLFFVAIFSSGFLLSRENPPKWWPALVSILCILQSLNMLTARYTRLIGLLTSRFDFLFMTCSGIAAVVEICMRLPWSIAYPFVVGIYPVMVLFIMSDIDHGDIAEPHKKKISFLTMVVLLGWLYLSHGNLIPGATFHFVTLNTTGVWEFGMVNSTETFLGNHTSADFSFDLHYFSDLRMFLVLLYTFKILAKPSEYCHLLDTHAVHVSVQSSGKRRLASRRRATELTREAIFAKLEMDEYSESLVASLNDDHPISVYLSAHRGRNYASGALCSFAYYSTCSFQFEKIVHTAFKTHSWTMHLSSMCAWILSLLGVTNVISHGWMYASLLPFAESILALFRCNTNILVLLVHEFNFLFPLLSFFIAVLLAAAYKPEIAPSSYYVFLISLFFYVMRSMLLDAFDTKTAVAHRKSYRGSVFAVAAVTTLVWCWSLFFIQERVADTISTYSFGKAIYKTNQATNIFRFASVTLMFLLRFCIATVLYPDRLVLYYFPVRRKDMLFKDLYNFLETQNISVKIGRRRTLSSIAYRSNEKIIPVVSEK